MSENQIVIIYDFFESWPRPHLLPSARQSQRHEEGQRGHSATAAVLITVAVVCERHRLGLLAQRPPSASSASSASSGSFPWHRSLWLLLSSSSSSSVVVTAATLFLMLVNGRRLGPTERSDRSMESKSNPFPLIAFTVVDTIPSEAGGANRLVSSLFLAASHRDQFALYSAK